MEKRLLLLCLFFCSVFKGTLASPSCVRTKDGSIVFTNHVYTGTPDAAKPGVISSNKVKQTFETTPCNAICGFGQYQNDIMNYRYQQIILSQNGTAAAIPFLVFTKNYGINWDNYPVSRVGDISSYQPFSSFKLLSCKTYDDRCSRHVNIKMKGLLT